MLPVLLLTVAAQTLVAPQTPPDTAKPAPFTFADFTWLNGTSRQSASVLDTKYVTGEFRLDASYIYDFNHPRFLTEAATTESGRTGEVQVQQLGIGGD